MSDRFCCDTGMRSGDQVHDRDCPRVPTFGAVMWEGTARLWVDAETDRCLRVVRRWLETEHPAYAQMIESEIKKER